MAPTDAMRPLSLRSTSPVTASFLVYEGDELVGIVTIDDRADADPPAETSAAPTSAGPRTSPAEAAIAGSASTLEDQPSAHAYYSSHAFAASASLTCDIVDQGLLFQRPAVRTESPLPVVHDAKERFRVGK